MSAPADDGADRKPGTAETDSVVPGEIELGDSSGEEAEPAPVKSGIGEYAHFDRWVSEFVCREGCSLLETMANLSNPQGPDTATQQQAHVCSSCVLPYSIIS